ncbi:cysteine desulfurase NifS [bacterium]|nr:cysteine desulfurase NifS [bacterium]
MRRVYADNNATTKVDDNVIEEMLPLFNEIYGNPSSMHTFGAEAEKALRQARERVGEFIKADPSEIIFTGSGTESDNTALFGTLQAYPGKKHIITTKVEHPAVLNPCQLLAKKGYAVTVLPVDSEGMLDLDELRDSIRDDTAIVSIMYANNETGVIFPIEEIGQIVKERGVVFHVDAVQAAGKIPLDVNKLNANLLSISGHKIHAPKGVAALYIRRGTRVRPFLIGGHQEKGKRGGTENLPSIVGFGKACELAAEHLDVYSGQVRAMRDRLQEGLLRTISETSVNGGESPRIPNTLSIRFEYVEGESILLLLDREGIAASSGSACTSGSLEPSHVLRAMGIPYTSVHGSIRFSLSRFNTGEDIDYILEKLPPIISKLREISPFVETTPAPKKQ